MLVEALVGAWAEESALVWVLQRKKTYLKLHGQENESVSKHTQLVCMGEEYIHACLSECRSEREL